MNRYRLILSYMDAGGYTEFTAIDDADAVVKAKRNLTCKSDRIISLTRLIADGQRDKHVSVLGWRPETPDEPELKSYQVIIMNNVEADSIEDAVIQTSEWIANGGPQMASCLVSVHGSNEPAVWVDQEPA